MSSPLARQGVGKRARKRNWTRSLHPLHPPDRRIRSVEPDSTPCWRSPNPRRHRGPRLAPTRHRLPAARGIESAPRGAPNSPRRTSAPIDSANLRRGRRPTRSAKTQANVGRENLAGGRPLILLPVNSRLDGTSLIRFRASGASRVLASLPQACGKGPAMRKAANRKDRKLRAVFLSDDDFADMGISIPTPRVSIGSGLAEVPGVPTKDASVVVRRRLRRGARFPRRSWLRLPRP